MELTHGKYFFAYINKIPTTGRILITASGTYLCQNSMNDSDNRKSDFGYDYAYSIFEPGVTHLEEYSSEEEMKADLQICLISFPKRLESFESYIRKAKELGWITQEGCIASTPQRTSNLPDDFFNPS